MLQGEKNKCLMNEMDLFTKKKKLYIYVNMAYPALQVHLAVKMLPNCLSSTTYKNF